MESFMVRVLFVVALVGCDYNASFHDCVIACTLSSGCPDGLTCGSEGLCRPSGSAECVSMLEPFGTPTLVASLSDPAADDDDPTLTADLLEIYFNSPRAGGQGLDIWHAIRASPTDQFGTPFPVTQLNSPSTEDTPGIAADGLTIWFASDRNGNKDIYVSTRPDRGSGWSIPVVVTALSSANADSCPEPSPTQLRMIVCQGAAGDRTLYESTRAATGAPWTLPVALASLNEATDQTSGFLHSPFEIWFSSVKDGPQSIYTAVRADVSSPFDAPMLVPVINDGSTNDDPWLSPDGRLIVFSSARSGIHEIWQATR